MNLACLLGNEETPESIAEAKKLYYEVIAGFTEHYGASHVETLASKMNLATLTINEARTTIFAWRSTRSLAMIR